MDLHQIASRVAILFGQKPKQKMLDGTLRLFGDYELIEPYFHFEGKIISPAGSARDLFQVDYDLLKKEIKGISGISASHAQKLKPWKKEIEAELVDLIEADPNIQKIRRIMANPTPAQKVIIDKSMDPNDPDGGTIAELFAA